MTSKSLSWPMRDRSLLAEPTNGPKVDRIVRHRFHRLRHHGFHQSKTFGEIVLSKKASQMDATRAGTL